MKKAVLIVHGFVGTLYDNEYLMNYLELDPHYDVYARTLPGHDKDRFSKAKMEDWLKFMDNQVQELNTEIKFEKAINIKNSDEYKEVITEKDSEEETKEEE